MGHVRRGVESSVGAGAASGIHLGLELARHATADTYHAPGLLLLASNDLREGLTRAFAFQRSPLAYRRRTRHEALSAHFGRAPQLGGPAAFIVLSEAWVSTPLPNANASFFRIFEQQAETELARLPPLDDLRARLRAEILRGLARGRFSLNDCARARFVPPCLCALVWQDAGAAACRWLSPGATGILVRRAPS